MTINYDTKYIVFEPSHFGLFPKGIAMIYLITNGEIELGADPAMTSKGFKQIQDLWSAVLALPVFAVVVGTGKRFQQVFESLASHIQMLRLLNPMFSPLCGSADVKEKEANGRVILATGRPVEAVNYLGVHGIFAVDAWEFIHGLPPNTLLCAGDELATALGAHGTQEGCLFEIDPAKRAIRKIAEAKNA